MMASNAEVNRMQRTSSRLFLGSMCLLLAAILLLGNAGTAAANVPTVLQIENISQGSAGKIRLQIAHEPPPALGPAHYVDMVEVQVAGVTKQFNLQPQSTSPFTVELDLGAVQGTPDVTARAHCNLHGWSDWSQTITVPEFPTMAIITSTLLATMLVIRAGSIIRETRKRRDWPTTYSTKVRRLLDAIILL
jgi:desulfoferrodoxin (superoxide reductase-like protein)